MKHFLIEWANKKEKKNSVVITGNDIISVLYRFEHEYDNANQITSIKLTGITINGIYYHL